MFYRDHPLSLLFEDCCTEIVYASFQVPFTVFHLLVNAVTVDHLLVGQVPFSSALRSLVTVCILGFGASVQCAYGVQCLSCIVSSITVLPVRHHSF